ncbi:FAD-binding protein [Paraburkholderia phytofirmans]|uniref:FAD-binding protein n=1 Tax=Paraburkholderia phytofirmans TaxID=261302 RepID=UPI0038BB7B35
MAGMTAAAYAAEHGRSVLVVEKQSEIGGSARLSGGGFWSAEDYQTLRAVNPLGEAALARALIAGYDAAADFISSLGADISAREPYLGTQSLSAVMRHLNVADYMARARSCVQSNGGWVVAKYTVTALVEGDQRVAGGLVSGPGGEVEVRARWNLLATGGFQNDPALRARYLNANAATMAECSNFASDGQGLRLGESVGAALSAHMSAWYGHTIPHPVSLPLVPAEPRVPPATRSSA